MKTGKAIKSGIPVCVRLYLPIIALLLIPLLGTAAELSGLVVGVNDGDTIKVLDDSRQHHTIRLMGIDAPEKTQAFGQQSKQSLSDLVYGQRVLVQWSKRDKYGRTVGTVLTQDGKEICIEQINRGMAWHYKKYAAEQASDDRSQYDDAEKVARASKLGLWHEDTPVPPWVWRRSRAR